MSHKQYYYTKGDIRLVAMSQDYNKVAFLVCKENVAPKMPRGWELVQSFEYMDGEQQVYVWTKPLDPEKWPSYKSHTFVVGGNLVSFELDGSFAPLVVNEIERERETDDGSINGRYEIEGYVQVCYCSKGEDIKFTIWTHAIRETTHIEWAPMPFNVNII